MDIITRKAALEDLMALQVLREKIYPIYIEDHWVGKVSHNIYGKVWGGAIEI